MIKNRAGFATDIQYIFRIAEDTRKKTEYYRVILCPMAKHV